jgi:hypothetical protein
MDTNGLGIVLVILAKTFTGVVRSAASKAVEGNRTPKPRGGSTRLWMFGSA